MKKNILFTLVFLFSFGLFAQNKKIKTTQKYMLPEMAKQKVKISERKSHAFETATRPYRVNPLLLKDNSIVNSKNTNAANPQIGATIYDLQTNSCVDNSRLVKSSDGSLSAIWTRSTAGDYSTRGSGYNYFDGSVWQTTSDFDGSDDDLVLEQMLDDPYLGEYHRTGWPSMAVTESGREIIISHLAAAGSAPTQEVGGLMCLSRDNKGEGEWEQTVIHSGLYCEECDNLDDELDLQWPRVAVGGEDGNTIHLIAVTQWEEDQNYWYGSAKQSRALVYLRSTDAGETWSTPVVIEALADSILTGYWDDETGIYEAGTIGGDDYSISANGNTVAIAYLNVSNPIIAIKSEDNGETWDDGTIVAGGFPIPYNVRSEFIIDMDQGETEDADGIRFHDGQGNILVDNNGEMHVFFGWSEMSDMDLTDEFYNAPLGSDGLYYWAEEMGGMTENLLPPPATQNPEDYDFDALLASDFYANFYTDTTFIIKNSGDSVIYKYFTGNGGGENTASSCFQIATNAIPVVFMDTTHLNLDEQLAPADRKYYNATTQLIEGTHNGSLYRSAGNMSQPTSGVDANNNIFIAYSAADVYANAHPTGENRRHIFVSSLKDGAEHDQWSIPYNTSKSFIPDFVGSEDVYPCISRNVSGNKVDVIYMSGEKPGIGINSTEENPIESETNKIKYFTADYETISPVGIENKPVIEKLQVELYPNPAKDNITISLNMTEKSNLRIDIINLVGQNVMTLENKEITGIYNETFNNIKALDAGVYFVNISINNKTTTKKLVVK